MRPILPKNIIQNLNKVGFYISFFDFFGKEIKQIKRIINNSKILKKITRKNKIKELLEKNKFNIQNPNFYFLS